MALVARPLIFKHLSAQSLVSCSRTASAKIVNPEPSEGGIGVDGEITTDTLIATVCKCYMFLTIPPPVTLSDDSIITGDEIKAILLDTYPTGARAFKFPYRRYYRLSWAQGIVLHNIRPTNQVDYRNTAGLTDCDDRAKVNASGVAAWACTCPRSQNLPIAYGVVMMPGHLAACVFTDDNRLLRLDSGGIHPPTSNLTAVYLM